MRKKFAYAAKLALISVAILGVVLGSFGLLAQEVSAATSAEELLKKTLLNGLRTCTNATYMKKEIIPADYTGISSLMTSDGNADGTILVPTKVGNSLNDGDVSCKELFLGYSGWGGEISGLLSLYGKNDDNLENFGYKIDTATTSGASREGCLSYDYSYPDGNRQKTATTNEICFEVDSDGNVVIEDWSDVKYDKASSPVGIQLGFASPPSGTIDLYSPNVTYYIPVVSGLNLSSMRTTSWDDITEKFKENGEGISTLMDSYSGQSFGYEFEGANITLDGGESYSVAKKQGNSRLDIMHYLTGDSTIGDVDIRFTENDKYSLYSEYFNMARENYQTLTVASECTSTMQSAKQDTGYAIRIGDEWCAAYGVEDVNESYNIVNERGNGLVNASFADMMEAMMNLNYDEIDEVNDITDAGLTGGVDPSSDPDDDGVEDPCYSNSGAMGWIMCPLINGISGALEALYGFVEGLLEVPPELLNNGSGGTYSAWNLFRNIANVLLIVAILAIILSQLTGFGINNYGIKKMLPRAVALAIIINVSYIICQLAVDLSNIVGYSLKDFLEGVAGSISGMSSGGSWFNGVLLEVTGVIAIGGAVTEIALSGWALIVPILLTLVTAVLAVLFMFILLGVRQALVVLLVALSPVIVVLYTLPNTQKLAQRATHMFSGLLMMFPLAGLLIGGSQLASAILISSGSSSGDATVTWLMQLIGLALMVVPYFFLPMVLRSSLQLADGALGKISGLTQRGSGALRGAAKGRAENSAYARRFSQNNINRKLDRQRKRVERRTGKFKEGKGIARLGAPGRALAGARLQAAESVYAQTANQAQGAEKMLDEAAMASAVQVYGTKSVTDISNAAKSAIDSKFTDTDAGKRQFKALVAMLADRKGGDAELEKLMRDLAIGQDNAKNVSAFQEALTPEVMSKIKGKSVVAGALAGAIADANTKTGASYGQHANGKAMSYQEFAQDAVKKASVEDLVGQSSGAFKRSSSMMSDSQIDAMHDDTKSMNRLSQENRDWVSSNYNTRHPREDNSGGDLSPDKKVDLR